MKYLILTKKIIVLAFFALLVVQCQKDEETDISDINSLDGLNEVIATDENGISITESDYKEFESERKKLLEEVDRRIEEDKIETRAFIKNGHRVDMENITPQKPTIEQIKKMEEIERKVKKFLNEPLDEYGQKRRLLYKEFDKRNKKKIHKRGYWELSRAYNSYSNSCDGGDRQSNNCAHYLSNAFIKGGFSELARNNSYINARCYGDFSSYYQKRPVRARDMRDWFRSKSSQVLICDSWYEIIREMRYAGKTHFAIYQDGGGYWGGHVLLYNISANGYSGTGNYTYWPTHEAYSLD